MDNVNGTLYCIKKWVSRTLMRKQVDISLATIFGVPKKTVIGEYTSINYDVLVGATRDSKVSMGKFCSIGPGCKLIVGNHPLGLPSTSFILWAWVFEEYDEGNLGHIRYKNQDINMGNDVWMGANTIVLPGVNIGDGAVIAAGSIVTKDIPPYAIAAGNPAKIKKYRFGTDVIELLQSTRWWDWDPERIRRNIKFFSTDLKELSASEIKKIIVE